MDTDMGVRAGLGTLPLFGRVGVPATDRDRFVGETMVEALVLPVELTQIELGSQYVASGGGGGGSSGTGTSTSRGGGGGLSAAGGLRLHDAADRAKLFSE